MPAISSSHWSRGPAVVTGSHLDSVPRGGHLDGTLGVLCGLEVLTTLLESKIVLTKAIELIAFFDEEGRFGSMIGSKAMAGVLDDAAIAHAQDETGRLLTEFLATEDRSAGLLLQAEVVMRLMPSLNYTLSKDRSWTPSRSRLVW